MLQYNCYIHCPTAIHHHHHRHLCLCPASLPLLLPQFLSCLITTIITAIVLAIVMWPSSWGSDATARLKMAEPAELSHFEPSRAIKLAHNQNGLGSAHELAQPSWASLSNSIGQLVQFGWAAWLRAGWALLKMETGLSCEPWTHGACLSPLWLHPLSLSRALSLTVA